ncbi:MAG: ABC transporter ATP-binding protein [Acidimicrobiia bacterium]
MSASGRTPNALTVCSLSKAYGQQPVLTDIGFTASGGTIFTVTGTNGSGKSTLLRCIAGLASHRGSVTFRGEPIASMRQHVGYLPQSVGLPPWATVGEVVAFFARLRRVDPADSPLPAGFVPDSDRPIKVLSGGQRQRVALAVALLGEPSLVLLDEPFANLDDQGRAVLTVVLRAAADDGRTVVIATPTESDLGGLDQTVIKIVGGRIAGAKPDHPTGCDFNGKAPAAAASQVSR